MSINKERKTSVFGYIENVGKQKLITGDTDITDVSEEVYMPNILDIAKYIYDKYYHISNTSIDELKLHKILYFAQRESLALTGKPLFVEEFRAWKHGPVSLEVRHAFSSLEVRAEVNLDYSTEYILNNVIQGYGSISSWKLSELSHNEISWRNARKGLQNGENGNEPMLLSDIREDAKKVRPFDHVWGMYYDEFEDFEEGVDG